MILARPGALRDARCAAAAAALTLLLAGCGGAADRAAATTTTTKPAPAAASPADAASPTVPPTTAPHRPAPPYAVGVRVFAFVDHSRTIKLPDGRVVPRTLVTIVRYPAAGPSNRTDVAGAVPARAGGPYPLVVFGHGFDVTPAPYAALLRAWTRAGFVVAAPLFPMAIPSAPGGPNEYDLDNEPRDLRFVVTELLAQSSDPASPLAALIDPRRIAVAGHSDGADAALADADSRCCRDPRVRAAVILSGALQPWSLAGFFAPAGVPLLAAQGSADQINPPYLTQQYFAAAPPPKYLLVLLGAGHLPPFSYQQPQLALVERVTTAFLRRYLDGDQEAGRRLVVDGNVRGVATLTGVG